MAQFFSTIGRHLECAIQTELVVELELALIEIGPTPPPPADEAAYDVPLTPLQI